MKLETFFNKFDELADTPDGIKSMRELVLRLAFSGGLTGKRPTDDGVPYGWESRTIQSISASITSGFACSRSHQIENGHVHLRTHNISILGTLNFDLLVRIDPKKVDPQKASICAGDILFNNTNSQELVGKTSLVDRNYDYGFSNHITRLRLKDGIFPGFVVFYLTLLRNSGYFARLCTRWINQAAVNTDTLKEQMIPLPPLAEQKRIVAKVNELMALCDRLEAQQQEREARHAALARASLARFAEYPQPSTLNLFFHPSYTILPADLRKSILTLAVQGKLVHQDPNDEPVEDSVRVARKQAGLGVRELGGARDEAPFEAPESWHWVTVADVSDTRLGKMLDKEKNRGEAHPYLRNTNVHWFRFELDTIKTMLFEQSELGEYRLQPGDVMICEGGHGIARSAVWKGQIPGAMFQKALHRVRPLSCLNGHFLTFCLWVYERDEFLQSYYTGAGIPHFTGKALARVTFPLPPVAEQRRIVAKVDQLMALVDALETQLAASRATASNLLSAIVTELTKK